MLYNNYTEAFQGGNAFMDTSKSIWIEGNNGDFYTEQQEKKKRLDRMKKRESIIADFTVDELLEFNKKSEALTLKLEKCVTSLDKTEEIKDELNEKIILCVHLAAIEFIVTLIIYSRIKSLRKKKIKLTEKLEYLPDTIIKKRK